MAAMDVKIICALFALPYTPLPPKDREHLVHILQQTLGSCFVILLVNSSDFTKSLWVCDMGGCLFERTTKLSEEV